VCAHTQTNTHVPKLRGALSPHRKCTNGIRASQTYAHTHRHGTRRDTHRFAHTLRHACRHTCPSWKTRRPLQKYTNRVQGTQTQVRAHTHTQAGRQTDPHTDRLRHTDMGIHRHAWMCMHARGRVQSTDTHCRNAQITHAHGRAALNLDGQLVSWQWGNRRSLSWDGKSEPRSPCPLEAPRAPAPSLGVPGHLTHRGTQEQKPQRSCLPATHLVWIILIPEPGQQLFRSALTEPSSDIQPFWSSSVG